VDKDRVEGVQVESEDLFIWQVKGRVRSKEARESP